VNLLLTALTDSFAQVEHRLAIPTLILNKTGVQRKCASNVHMNDLIIFLYFSMFSLSKAFFVIAKELESSGWVCAFDAYEI